MEKIISKEELGNIYNISLNMLFDEKDPSSPNYKRVIKRPNINWIKGILWLIVLIINIMMLHIFLKTKYYYMFIAILILFIALTMKRTLIYLVRIYQKFAPEKIRRRCRFEPSCSEYMILAIEKYGCIKGVYKGINRLRRCNINNGGFDEP